MGRSTDAPHGADDGLGEHAALRGDADQDGRLCVLHDVEEPDPAWLLARPARNPRRLLHERRLKIENAFHTFDE
jgi:hypothetical protein